MPIDLTTHYGGLQLTSPIVVGACPLTANELSRIALISAGTGAIVLPSLFVEQVLIWNQENNISESSITENVQEGWKQAVNGTTSVITDANSYLELIKQASSSVSIPVIASINGECTDQWLDFAAQIELAGASAVEFNVRRPNPHKYSEPREVEDSLVIATAKLAAKLSIPLFLKLGRHFTSLSHLARRLLNKADGLVLFGYAPVVDISMESLQLETSWGFTEPGSVARSIESIMRVHSFCPEMPLAAGGGIGSAHDIPKVLLAGADVAMIASAVYRDGPDIVASWLDSLKVFMQRHDMSSIADLKSRRPTCFDDVQERSHYIKALSTPPAPDMIRSADRVLHCDRWGHVNIVD